MKLENLVKAISWRQTKYIKTHEYFVRKENPEVFDNLLREIKNEGYYEEFMGRKYKYLNIGEYQYWSIYPVLNRSKLEKEEAHLEQ